MTYRVVLTFSFPFFNRAPSHQFYITEKKTCEVWEKLVNRNPFRKGIDVHMGIVTLIFRVSDSHTTGASLYGDEHYFGFGVNVLRVTKSIFSPLPSILQLTRSNFRALYIHNKNSGLLNSFFEMFHLSSISFRYYWRLSPNYSDFQPWVAELISWVPFLQSFKLYKRLALNNLSHICQLKNSNFNSLSSMIASYGAWK